MVDQLVTVTSLGRLLSDHGNDVDAVTDFLLPPEHPRSEQPYATRTLRAQLGSELRAIDTGTRSESDATDSAYDITTIRNALVATRQWEILTHDLGESWNPSHAPPAGPVDVRAELRTRLFGAETLREPEKDHVDALHDRFDELVTATGETVVSNLAGLNPSALTPRRAEAVRMVVKGIGRIAVSRVLGRPKSPPRRALVRAVIALLALVVVGVAVIGFVRDRWAFFFGIGVALIVLLIPAWELRRWLRRLATTPAGRTQRLASRQDGRP